jgi:hypothetical protein
MSRTIVMPLETLEMRLKQTFTAHALHSQWLTYNFTPELPAMGESSTNMSPLGYDISILRVVCNTPRPIDPVSAHSVNLEAGNPMEIPNSSPPWQAYTSGTIMAKRRWTRRFILTRTGIIWLFIVILIVVVVITVVVLKTTT